MVAGIDELIDLLIVLGEQELRVEIRGLFQRPEVHRGLIDPALRRVIILAFEIFRSNLPSRPATARQLIGTAIKFLVPIVARQSGRMTNFAVIEAMVARPKTAMSIWYVSGDVLVLALKRMAEKDLYEEANKASIFQKKVFASLIKSAEDDTDKFDLTKVSKWYPDLPQIIEEIVVEVVNARQEHNIARDSLTSLYSRAIQQLPIQLENSPFEEYSESNPDRAQNPVSRWKQDVVIWMILLPFIFLLLRNCFYLLQNIHPGVSSPLLILQSVWSAVLALGAGIGGAIATYDSDVNERRRGIKGLFSH
jgi:hypothetical protein